jgi:hypothetical protein
VRKIYDVVVDFINTHDKSYKQYVFTVGSSSAENAKKKGESECKRMFSSARSVKAVSVSERKLGK